MSTEDTNTGTEANTDDTLARRDVLQRSIGVLSAAGLGASGLARADGLDTVKIPRYIGSDGVDEWLEVPKRWNDHRKHVKDVRTRFNQQFIDLPGVRGISTVRAPDTYGGKPGMQIKVEVEEPSAAGSIPAAFEDVPVTTHVVSRDLKPAGCYNDSYQDPLHGGYEIEDPAYEQGTTCCWVNSDTKGDAVLTANHIAFSECDNDLGTQMDQGGQPLGEVVQYHNNLDFCLVDNSDGNHSPSSYLDETNSQHRVEGVVADASMDHILSSDPDNCDHTIYQMGVTTGKTQGCLTGRDLLRDQQDECITYEYNNDGHGIETSCVAGQGDSGGPFFEDNGDWVYVVGLCSWYTNGSPDCNGNYAGEPTYGVQAHHLRNSWGMTFDTDY